MKKLIIASALSAAFVSPAVFAQATGFTGFYGQVGLGMSTSNTNNSLSDTEIATGAVGELSLSGKVGQQNVAGAIALGYNYGFRNGLNLGANVFYNISGDSAGSVNFDGGEEGSLNISSRLKNIWGISVEPGYAFNNDSLGYLKLGWAQAQPSMTLAGEGGSLSSNLGTANGFLYGVGFKHALNKNIYIGVEVYQIAFSKQSRGVNDGDGYILNLSSKPTYTYGGIVLGARF
jgi:opacity protein-like surface antigen